MSDLCLISGSFLFKMLFINSVSLAGKKKIGCYYAEMSRRCHCLVEVSADELNMNDGPYYLQKVIKTIKNCSTSG
jgi:hypothetical protein